MSETIDKTLQPQPHLTFTKSERLCSRRWIDSLFAEGHRLMQFPFSVHWQVVAVSSEENRLPMPAQVLITTTKRKFHHAVDRNRVKRLVRECYRKQKPELYAFLRQNDLQIVFSINYTHNEILDYSVIETKHRKMMTALIHQIQEVCSAEMLSHSKNISE